ncbi:hypothetical protein DC31_01065 [Microbacterium sp. CH12i]|nr:hypothetical protein DC31_01065 [Microbacterium sp. CH12i]
MAPLSVLKGGKVGVSCAVVDSCIVASVILTSVALDDVGVIGGVGRTGNVSARGVSSARPAFALSTTSLTSAGCSDRGTSGSLMGAPLVGSVQCEGIAVRAHVRAGVPTCRLTGGELGVYELVGATCEARLP